MTFLYLRYMGIAQYMAFLFKAVYLQQGKNVYCDLHDKNNLNVERETVPLLTSDMGKKTVSVLAQSGDSGYIL